MSELFVELIDFNEDIDYSTFLTMFCSYLIVLWLVISLWVGVDSWKRYGSKKLAFVFFVLTFFLSFPMVIFYFIIRPEDKMESYEDWDVGGVNVPMVNFVGKKGVEMSLELKIHPSKITSQQDSDMKIDVSWDSVNKEMKLVPPVGIAKSKVEQTKHHRLTGRMKQQISTTFFVIEGFMAKQIEAIKETSVRSYANAKARTKQNKTSSSKKEGITKGKTQVNKKIRKASKSLKDRLKEGNKLVAAKKKRRSRAQGS